MGEADQVIRYRRRALVRWAPAAVAAASALVFIAAAAVTGDAGAMPVGIATCLVTAAVAAGLVATRGVTISPTALIVSSPRGRRTIPWPEIEAVQVRGSALWIMTRSGWHALPIPASTSAATDAARAPLGPEVWAAWLERRGASWRPEGLAPWTPAMDLRGRVVLRPPIEGRALVVGTLFVQLAATAIGSTLGRTIVLLQDPDAPAIGANDPWVPLWVNLIVLTLTVSVTAAVHWRSRVVIDAETVHIRTLVRDVRIPRASIVGLHEVSGGLAYDQRLAIDHGFIGPDGRWSGWTTRLPGPANSTRFALHDPGFYAKWAWLQDQLIVARWPLSSMADNRATT